MKLSGRHYCIFCSLGLLALYLILISPRPCYAQFSEQEIEKARAAIEEVSAGWAKDWPKGPNWYSTGDSSEIRAQQKERGTKRTRDLGTALQKAGFLNHRFSQSAEEFVTNRGDHSFRYVIEVFDGGTPYTFHSTYSLDGKARAELVDQGALPEFPNPNLFLNPSSIRPMDQRPQVGTVAVDQRSKTPDWVKNLERDMDSQMGEMRNAINARGQ